ncbi:MAG: AmmeMemoRadiSam system radical SAM enzyme [Bradymonadales bacterium]|nr:AmmeMemoRadiSam system radical SAM enzyme [Bradymonadales bacterium]
MHQAMLWDKKGENKVLCRLCPHNCLIAPGKRGICGVRENQEGVLVALSYDRVSSMAVDPIEKKPLYHVRPGAQAFSFATPGCNLDCLHCQNASLSQEPKERDGRISGRAVDPQLMVAAAKEQGCEIISATYSEPTIFFELALDVAKLAKSAGLLNTWVTNGFTSADARDLLIPYLDAANVDLKSFEPKTYKTLCKARLEPVLETIRDYRARGVWVEVTTLVIPGINDDPKELRSIARFIAEVDRVMPWHISAFHPDYKMLDRPRTPTSTLETAYEIGREEGLLYVYTGNVHDGHTDTLCPSCQKTVVRRSGFWTMENLLVGDRCPHCNGQVHGLFATAGRGG